MTTFSEYLKRHGDEKMMQDYCLGVINEPKEFYDRGKEIMNRTIGFLIGNMLISTLLVINCSFYFVYINNISSRSTLILSCILLLSIVSYTIIHRYVNNSFLIKDKFYINNVVIWQYMIFIILIVLQLCNDVVNTYLLLLPNIALLIFFIALTKYFISISKLENSLIDSIISHPENT